METLLKLVQLLNETNKSDYARKLQTAFYIAQNKTGCWLYNYKVSRGRVYSDELDQDFAQLSSFGFIKTQIDEFGDILYESSSKDLKSKWLEENEMRISEILNNLYEEDAETLEAAATRSFFNMMKHGDPNQLSWYNNLPGNTQKRAEEILDL